MAKTGGFNKGLKMQNFLKFRRKQKSIAGYMYCPFCQQNTLVNEVKVKHPKGMMRQLSCSVCNILLYTDLVSDDAKQSVMLDAIEEIYEK